jgi:hypothetical protein
VEALADAAKRRGLLVGLAMKLPAEVRLAQLNKREGRGMGFWAGASLFPKFLETPCLRQSRSTRATLANRSSISAKLVRTMGSTSRLKLIMDPNRLTAYQKIFGKMPTEELLKLFHNRRNSNFSADTYEAIGLILEKRGSPQNHDGAIASAEANQIQSTTTRNANDQIVTSPAASVGKNSHNNERPLFVGILAGAFFLLGCAFFVYCMTTFEKYGAVGYFSLLPTVLFPSWLCARVNDTAKCINGCGTVFYGNKKMPDFYITTKWITFLYVPLLPVRSYAIRFLDVKPLPGFGIYWPQVVTTFIVGIFGLVIGVGLIVLYVRAKMK